MSSSATFLDPVVVPLIAGETVLASEIIEHMEQRELPAVLDALEGAANRPVIITTPNFPYYRGGSETIVGFNEFEAHHAYVSQHDLV